LFDDFWRDRSVLVTGANGFVGSWIARVLTERGANVVALVRDMPVGGGLALQGISERVTVVAGNLTDDGLVERVLNEYNVDACFHLAAQAIVTVANRAPLSTFESNMRGTWHVLEACRNTHSVTRVVVASSDKAYGSHATLPYTEEFELRPQYPYDVSKAATDMLARSYFSTFGSPVAVTRCANIYGGGDLNYSRIIPDSIRLLLQHRPPVIRSDGTPERDYMYIADAVEGYLRLAEQMDEPGVAGQAFNFGTENPISVLDLVKQLIAISGHTDIQPTVTGTAKPAAEIDTQYLASKKAHERLGWRPRYDLRNGLRETYRWFANFPAATSAPNGEVARVLATV
jgi:CDP-glucose 4,6-dehydratase